MLEPASPSPSVAPKAIGVVAAVVVMGVLGGYAIHEHSTAQDLAADNVQTTAALNLTQHQLSDLSAKVNMLAARNETPPAPTAAAAPIATGRAAETRPLKKKKKTIKTEKIKNLIP